MLAGIDTSEIDVPIRGTEPEDNTVVGVEVVGETLPDVTVKDVVWVTKTIEETTSVDGPAESD